MESTHLIPKFSSHAIVDISWKDLVPVLAKIRDPGIMKFQHVLKVITELKLTILI